MASPGKRGRSAKSFNWTDEYKLVLLKLCANFKALQGPKQAYKWGEIISEFEKLTGTRVTKDVLPNKLSQMKLEYGAWKRLKNSETGLGYDPISRHILADPLWWEKKIEENKEYKKFRTNGVPKEVEDLWAFLFEGSMATGEFLFIPGMSRSHAINFDEVEETDENSLGRDDLECKDLDPGLVNLMENMGTPKSAQTTPVEMMRSEYSPPPGAQSVSAHGSASQRKKQRRLLSKQDIALEHMGAMREHMDTFMDIVKSNTPTGSITSQEPINSLPSENEALEILYHMANNGIIERRSALFGYSLTFLLDEKIRKMFMAVSDDEDRKFFLQSQYEMKVHK